MFLAIILFLLGIIVGNYISGLKLQQVQNLESDLRVESLGNELLFQLVSDNLCENINTTTYTTEMSNIGKKLTHMEDIYGYDSPNVWNMKNYYTLLLIRHWLIVEKSKKICNLDTPSVLYFYTNEGCADCEDQGLVLTNVHNNYPLFNIYAFEFAIENPSTRFLKEKYGIKKERLPTIVIDDKVFYGFQTKEFLVRYMDLEIKLTEQKKLHPDWY